MQDGWHRVHLLLVIASILVLIGAHLLLLNVDANKWIIIACLVPFLLHLLLLFIYFLYFTISDTRSGQGYYTSGLSQWIESHHQISIFRNAFYAVFAVMIVIGFVGLGLSSSVFFHEKIPADNRTYSGEMLLKQDEETMQDTMKACNWQFHSLTIQDMVLIAALAYR